jgi:hypothetical protein
MRGFISAENVPIHDFNCAAPPPGQDEDPNPHCDFIINGLQFYTSAGEGLQLGFAEGSIPWNPANFSTGTPKVFMEYNTVCDGQNFIQPSTPSANPRYNEYFEIRWNGFKEVCGGVNRCRWIMARGASFAPITTLRSSTSCEGNATATTEHFDNVYMEPNEVQCFGGGFSGSPCTSIPVYGYDLFLYLNSYFYLWQSGTFGPPAISERDCPPPSSDHGYSHHVNVAQDWYSIRTEGCWE